MPFDFPDAPTADQEVTAPGGAVYNWNGTRWVAAGQSTAYMPLAGDSTKDGALTVTGALAANSGATITGNATAVGKIASQGAIAGYSFQDKDDNTQVWEWTSTNNIAVLNHSNGGTAHLSVDADGNAGVNGNFAIRGDELYMGPAPPANKPTMSVGTTSTYIMPPGDAISQAGLIIGGAAESNITYQRNTQHVFQDVGGGMSYAIFTAGGTYNQSTTWLAISDATLKENIAPYQRGLEAIRGLSPVTYNYKAGTPFADENNTLRVGLLAQDLEKIAPEFVGEDEFAGYEGVVKTAAPGNLIYPLINAVQELLTRVEELEKKK